MRLLIRPFRRTRKVGPDLATFRPAVVSSSSTTYIKMTLWLLLIAVGWARQWYRLLIAVEPPNLLSKHRTRTKKWITVPFMNRTNYMVARRPCWPASTAPVQIRNRPFWRISSLTTTDLKTKTLPARIKAAMKIWCTTILRSVKSFLCPKTHARYLRRDEKSRQIHNKSPNLMVLQASILAVKYRRWKMVRLVS